MSAHDAMQPHQFKMKHDPPIVSGHWEGEKADTWVDTPPEQGNHMLTALAGNNRPLGHMTWDKGVVKGVHVNESQQHKGIATQMWEHANKITPGLSHSSNRSDQGNAWAKKVGGPLPERVQDHPEWGS